MKMKNLAVTILVILGFAATLQAGSDGKDSIQGVTDQPTVSEKDWRLELGSGIAFSNVRESDKSETGYTIVPTQLSGIYKIDDVSLDHTLGGVLRGNTEFIFRGDGYTVVHGPEDYLLGISAGPRYNFVQPGWKVVPFAEGTVGVLFADSDPTIQSNGMQRGLGEDFNFTFSVALGARYDITDCLYVSLAAQYFHVSNAGLSEPQHENKPIDALGPQLAIGCNF